MRQLYPLLLIPFVCLLVYPAYARAKPVEEKTKERLLRTESKEQKTLRRELKKKRWVVVFSSNAERASNIYRMNSDGSELLQLTDENTSTWGSGGWGPQVSPDGTKILWMSTSRKEPLDELKQIKLDPRYPLTKRSQLTTTIWMMDADGKNWEFLSIGKDPSWSPDGKFIAYTMNMVRKSERPVGLLKVETKSEVVVTPRNWKDYKSLGMPRFTPDGQWILSGGGKRLYGIPLFSEKDPDDDDDIELNKPVRLIRGKGDEGCNQEVSPDGKTIVWVIDTHSAYASWLCMAPINYQKPQRPKFMKLGWNTKTVNYDPCFSPDGKYMIYMHGAVNRNKKSYEGVISELYVTRFPPDGVNVRVTWLNAATRHPHWVEKLEKNDE